MDYGSVAEGSVHQAVIVLAKPKYRTDGMAIVRSELSRHFPVCFIREERDEAIEILHSAIGVSAPSRGFDPVFEDLSILPIILRTRGDRSLSFNAPSHPVKKSGLCLKNLRTSRRPVSRRIQCIGAFGKCAGIGQ